MLFIIEMLYLIQTLISEKSFIETYLQLKMCLSQDQNQNYNTATINIVKPEHCTP